MRKLRNLLFLSLITRMSTTIHSNNIIIIGGGAAGLSSALEISLNEGTEVYLLEKMSKVGGNSAKASSGYVLLLLLIIIYIIVIINS